MRRAWWVAVALAAALAACSHRPAGTATPASATPAPTAPSAPPVSPSAAAPAATGAAPTRTFPFAVRRLALSRGADRPLRTTIWYPAGGAGPFPLILFSHGLTAEPADYAGLLSRWAGAGFVVAGPAYPHTSSGVSDYNPLDVANQPADASYVITKVLALNARPGDPLRGRIDIRAVAAAGHSAGGITTVALFSGSRDPRLVAGVVVAGRQLFAAPFTGPPAPLLFVHGRLDRTVPYADALATFEAVPWPKAMLTVTAGGHVTTRADFAATAATTTDFWRWALYGDRAARQRLRADATRSGVATLTDHL
jgi:fermentation-respiration switch protein FrsA (DUF1100 family)